MTVLRTVRGLGFWFCELFLLAQLLGVVPLMSAHANHVLKTREACAEGQAPVCLSHDDHGTADLNDECCALHGHLIAVIPSIASVDRTLFIKETDNSPQVKALTDVEPVLTDPPPKTL